MCEEAKPIDDVDAKELAAAIIRLQAAASVAGVICTDLSAKAMGALLLPAMVQALPEAMEKAFDASTELHAAMKGFADLVAAKP